MYSPSIAGRNRASAKRRYGAIACSFAIVVVVTAGVTSWQPTDSGVNNAETLRPQASQPSEASQSDDVDILAGAKQTIYLVDSPRQAIALRHSLPEFTDPPRDNALIVSSQEEAMLIEWYVDQGDDRIQLIDLRGTQNAYDVVSGYQR
jgi:hypothetical protein